jgi:hypothetical protein
VEPRRQVSSRAIVGRDAALHALDRVLDAAGDGARQLFMFRG